MLKACRAGGTLTITLAFWGIGIKRKRPPDGRPLGVRGSDGEVMGSAGGVMEKLRIEN